MLIFILANLHLIIVILTRHDNLHHTNRFLINASLLLLSATQGRLEAQVQDLDVLSHAAVSHLTGHRS